MRPAFRAGPAHVRVPATSANLGPGYDALGLALTLHDDVVGRVVDAGLEIDVAGEGEHLVRDETHLVVRAMRATFDVLGGQPRGLQLSCANRIPHGRGLGSSAAAIVGGIVLARALVVGGEHALPDTDAFALAARLEGHPDNVAACLRGGLTLAWCDGSGAHAIDLDVSQDIAPVVFVPGTSSSTKATRRMLPDGVPHGDAAHNAARSALLVEALRCRPDLLGAATEDRLHQPYRAEAMPRSTALLAELREAGIPAVVSGAGPTVLALTTTAGREAALAHGRRGWSVLALDIDREGAVQLPL
jgi:homoserine kinase